MAVIRKEIQVKRLGIGEKHVFDCVIETSSDLTATDLNDVGMGSMALCIADSKLYCKKADSTWAEVAV